MLTTTEQPIPHTDKNLPLLSILIPCYNEVQTIISLVQLVYKSEYPNKEIIVIDDCSNDGSREKLQSFSREFPHIASIFFHEKNLGKGAALRTGISAASGSIIIIQDADFEYDPSQYRSIIDPIIQDKADVVFGSRFMGGFPHRVVYFWHRVGNGFLTTLSNMFTNINLTDMETCYKAFRSEIIKSIHIEEDRFGFEPEITAKISKLNCRIYEVGISYYGRTYAEGKKIGWRDGIRAVICIFKYNLFR